MDTLTKENLLEVLASVNDAPYKVKLAKIIFNSLPAAAAYGLAWEMYLKYYHTGTIIKVTRMTYPGHLYFTTVTDVYKYIKESYPKSNQVYIYDCLKGNKPHAYDHTFEYVTPNDI
jgi:hypothetical protein